MKRILSVFFIAFLVVCAYPALAQAPVVKVALDKEKILIGEPVNFALKVFLPSNGYQLSSGGFPDTLPKITIIKKGNFDSSQQSDYQLFQQNIQFTSFDSGYVTIPAIHFIFSDGTSRQEVISDSLKLFVTYSPQDSIVPFHDINDIISVKPQPEYWKWIVVGLGILLFLILAIVLFKKYSKQKLPHNFLKNPEKAFPEALAGLNLLRSQLPIPIEDSKQFYTDLTDIFKRYLTQTYFTNYAQKTSDELLVALKDKLENSDRLFPFANTLRISDAVKFAKYRPDNLTNTQCVDEVEKMIGHIQEILKKESR